MLNSHIKHIFKYHLLMLLFLILTIAASRVVGDRVMKSEMYSPYMTEDVTVHFNELLEQSKGMTLEECAQFISKKQAEVFQGSAEQNETTAIMRYTSELQHCFEVRGYRNYCLYGKGIVSLNIPADIKSNSEKYLGFALPEVVNSDPFMKYLYLSSFGLMPVMILLLTAVLRADSYEKGVERQIMISSERVRFDCTRERLMILLIGIVCAVEQMSLLIMSRTLDRPEYVTASLQSVTGFSASAFRGTISQVIVFIIARQFLNALLCYETFALLSEKLCSVKKFILCAFASIAIMSLASYYVPELSPYMFAALGKTEYMVQSLDYISLFDSSEAVLVIILFSSLLGSLIALRRAEN